MQDDEISTRTTEKQFNKNQSEQEHSESADLCQGKIGPDTDANFGYG